MYLTGGGCEMNSLLWDPHTKCQHSRLFGRTVGTYELWLFQARLWWRFPLLYICNPNTQTEDVLANPGIMIYSKNSSRCITRTWTCSWQGNCIVKCLVPTSRQQCLHILNRCVESSSFKGNLNHLSVPSLPTTNHLWSFPLQSRRSPINSSWVWPSAGKLFPSCCITIYGFEGKRTNSCLFAVLVLLKKKNNSIVARRNTLVLLALVLKNLKAEK